MQECVLVDGVRTPIGRAHAEKGWLRTTRPEDLLGVLYDALFERNKAVKPEDIDVLMVGCANQSGAQNAVSRLSWLANGYPESVACNGVEMQCASAMAAMEDCARAIMVGEVEITIAGGVEMMQRIPMGSGIEFPPRLMQRYNPMELPMGPTAEKVAAQYKIERLEMEEFALASHQKAAKAQADGCFKDEIIPIEVTYEDGSKQVIDTDQCPRGDTTLEKMATMKPPFKPDGGVVTAATSSPLNDGAAASLLMSREKADALGLSYTLKYVGGAMAGVDPTVMGMGPVPAVQKVMKLTGMTLDQMGVVEINETFASQSIACLRELGIPFEKVNLWGGALALGHPLGISGCRIIVTLNSIMKANPSFKYGLATMCVGFGQGNATIWGRVD
ncbi:MAG: thiolase family protein [Deltaproteobacteria bacterium]|nr:thiolase family protein [Deltaproteobacteria bacterium]